MLYLLRRRPPGDVWARSTALEAFDRTFAHAVHHGELRMHYQPIVRISDREVVSMEALVRWQHPALGLMAPGQFLPSARRAGHLTLLDEWVLQQACADLVELTSRLGGTAPSSVNVNLSPQTLSGDFDELVISILQRTGLRSDRLRLELPEDADLQTLTAAGPRLERLIAHGVGVTLDDMGTGSTTMRYLSMVSIQGIKIDKDFVAGMGHNPRDHTVVKVLTELGHGLGLHVTAEGVETAEQLRALAVMGVGYAQGYHLAVPQPLDALCATLDTGGTCGEA
ncbi:EAL domain-containing protein (putative c-di-GMP-specific phosphodiesterase class I) [Catellatospora citrea]|nr:EAL domain-containing protein (putative c-di-GMP-specific phosphodiesterase class I) [Catellatospora citrea]